MNRPEAGKPAVTVKRLQKITLNGKSMTKEFTVVVQPKEAQDDSQYDGGYLWVNLRNRGRIRKDFLRLQ